MKKTILGLMLTLLLVGMMSLAFNIQQVGSSEPPATEWSRTYGGTEKEMAYELIQTSDGGYAIAGPTRSFGAGHYDFWLVKTNSTGHMQWNQTYGGANSDYAWSVVQTTDEGYALAGYTSSFGAGSFDFWLVKTNSTGEMQWNKTYGGPGYDVAESVVQTTDEGYALAGYAWPFGAGMDDFWLVKTDVNGVAQWNQTYGGLYEDVARSVVQTTDEGYALAGYTSSFGAGMDDFWLVKTNSTGEMEWNQTYGGADNDYARCVVQTGDGGYALAGHTESYGAGSLDSWLIKLAPIVISAVIDVDPNTFNLRSKGEWITAYVELPEGYDVADINVSTILLNGTIPADPDAPATIGDYNDDGAPDLMVKFDRADVISYILANVNMTQLYEERFMTITGYLNDETSFEGSDTVRIMMPGAKGAGKHTLRK